jgi:hypothetical protein
MSESVQTPYLLVNFGDEGGSISWNSLEEVRAWINVQRTDWQWISQLRTNPTNNAGGDIESPLQSCLNNLNNAEQHSGNEQHVTNMKREAVQHLERLYKKSPWLLPNSAYRKYIFELRDSGRPMEAGLITANLLGQDLNGAPLSKVVSALVEFELFSRGIKDRVRTESAALKKLVGEMTTLLDEQKQLQVNQAAEFATLNADVVTQTTTHGTSFDEAQMARDEAWKKQLQETEDELKQLNETYDTHMALAAPVSYWEGKRDKHSKWSKWSFIALTLCMAAFGGVLFCELRGVAQMIEDTKLAAIASSAANVKLGSVVTTAPAASALTPLLDVLATWKIGAYILLVTLAFWFIRLLVRIFLSNIHLENDASERVTMAKTYLALIRDGSFEGKEHIGTILAALFRPTGDGIVKDEGLPPTAMEWLTKLSGK